MIAKRSLLRAVLVFAAFFLAVEAAGVYLALRGQGEEAAVKGRPETLKRKNAVLKKRIEGFSPKGIYVVVDTAENVLYLKRGNEVLRKAVVSSGSGNVLEDPSGERTWVFDTPRGEHRVLKKVVDPDWIKPDWAFIEEGEEIPKKQKDRIESGVMGKYALGIGNGYLIHGTLYTRLLGRNVTHGCVRVGDEDLEALFKTVQLGAKVIIF